MIVCVVVVVVVVAVVMVHGYGAWLGHKKHANSKKERMTRMQTKRNRQTKDWYTDKQTQRRSRPFRHSCITGYCRGCDNEPQKKLNQHFFSCCHRFKVILYTSVELRCTCTRKPSSIRNFILLQRFITAALEKKRIHNNSRSLRS